MSSVKGLFSTYQRIYLKKNGGLLSKGLAYSFVFGIVPVLIGVFALASAGVGPETMLRSFVREEILALLPEQLRETVIMTLQGASADVANLGIATIIVFVLSAYQIFVSLGQTMSAMMDTDTNRPLVQHIVAFGLLLLLVFIIYVAAGGIAVARLVLPQSDAPIFQILSRLVAIAANGLVLIGLLHLFSRRRLRFWPTVFSAMGAAVLWQAIVSVTGIALTELSARFAVYGSVAWAIVLLAYTRLLAELIIAASILTGYFSPPYHKAVEQLLTD